jgi:hypothetical protein
MEYVVTIGFALFVGYLWGRQNARGQVFRQIYDMQFLSADQKETLRNFLIHRSGK